MFRPTSPQTSLFEAQFLIPKDKAARLAKSWAEPFRTRVLPLIDEEVFRDAFAADSGRPNTSIRLLVGLHLLRDWHDLTDAEVAEQLEYNLQWQYALGIEPAAAHVSEKTLWTFRERLKANGRAQQMFEGVTRGLAQMDGLRLGKQRLDSTHVVSNIAILTRLGLFVETVTVFMEALRRDLPDVLAVLPPGYAKRYLDREGFFGDAKRSQAPRRLLVVAEDVWALVERFEGDAQVRAMPAFVTLLRLFHEQCVVIEDDGGPSAGSGAEPGSDDAPAEKSKPAVRMRRVALREPKEIGGDSLQTPHDLDVTYGHKGKGYEVQLTETCDADNPYQLITATRVNGANESDQAAVGPMLDQLEASGMMPTVVIADTGYGSGANIVASAERDVELFAPVRDPNAMTPSDGFEVPAGAMSASDVTPTAVGADDTDQPVSLNLGDFAFDTTCQTALSCPAGQVPVEQHVSNGQCHATFPSEACGACPLAALCPTRELASGDRLLRRAPATIATELRQVEQQQPAFKEAYKIRSGIESTNHELKGVHGLDALRIRGAPQVGLAALLKAAALNVKRAVRYHVRRLAEVSREPCPSP